jgi:hypothetical protein
MKKYLIGAIFGVLLSFSVSVYAEEVKSLIGRAIEGQFPVKVDDKQLDNQAIVIDGTSYLPVRAIGDALNMEVGFNADLGITLKSKPKLEIEVKPTVTPQSSVRPLPTPYPQTDNAELQKVYNDLASMYVVLQAMERGLEGSISNLNKASESDKEYYQKRIDNYNITIPEQEAKIAILEAKKAALENPLYSAPGQASSNPLQE